MDPIKNPFSPGAGAPPPELVGREEILNQARILLGRVKLGRPEKSILMTGLRGVGKTVLLNELERMAEAEDYRTILLEVHEKKTLGEMLIPHLRRLLYDLDRMAGAGDKVRRGLSVLKSFVNSIKVTVDDVEFGLGIDPETGTADSGDMEIDLPNLFIAVAEAASERGGQIAILIDEVQYFKKEELSALIMSMHRMQQRQLPVVLFGAGLPTLPGLAGESKSYAERLFSFPVVGALNPREATMALQGPVQKNDVYFEVDALAEIANLTQGYPYFLQEWGYQAWNLSEGSPIELKTVQEASRTVIKRLDESFFRVRFDRLAKGEKRLLRAMAELGAGPHRTGDIADIMEVKISSLGPTRAKLIDKGMIFSSSYGEMAFTVPLFDKFLKRAIPEFTLNQ